MSYLAKSRRPSNTILRLLLVYLVLTSTLPVPAVAAQGKATPRTPARKSEQGATRPAAREPKERITPSALQASGKIAFASNRSAAQFDIFIMNPDGSGQTNISDNPADDRAPSFSPNGTKIVFESDRDGNDEIYSMNADGSFQTRLTNDTNFDYEPAFSPDGEKIVFTSERSGNAEIYVMNSDGSGLVNLSNHPDGDAEASFSPDGSKIVFVSTRDGGDGEVYLMNADGTNQTRLTANGGVSPSFSPDGSKITFTTGGSGVGNAIALMNSGGANEVALTNNAASDEQSAFSPDNTKIVFESDRDGNKEIYVMNPNGTAQTRLTNDGASDAEATWQTLLSCAPPPPNGVAWYRAEENADDSIGTNHGTLQGGTGIVQGFVGAAFEFDGVDDQIDIGQLTGLQNAQQLTLMAWVKKRDTSNTIAGIIGKWDGCTGCTDDTFLLYNSESVTVNKGGFVVRFTDDTAAAVAGTTDIPVGQWVHIAATWRSSDGEIKIYKNGRLDGSGTGGAGKTLKYQTNYTAKIGEWGEGHGGNPLYRFGGAIDEATIFNRALSQTEIRNVYDAKNEGKCLASAAQTITTSNTNDSGPGSLRQAILDANASPGAQTIDFNIPGAGVHTITPDSPLPGITDAVIIDGYTQPGASANSLATGSDAQLLIELDGTNANTDTALQLMGGGATIRGLVINRFQGGISVVSNNNVVAGNFIGTDAAGTAVPGNINHGVNLALATNNIIGGATPEARNLISGNIIGIIFENNSDANTVQGNYIGTDKTGTFDLGNSNSGIYIYNGSDNNLIGGTTAAARNVISGNDAHGLHFDVPSVSGNIVQGNFIGTQADGTSALANAGNGIHLDAVGANIIGGTAAGAGNTIAFNGGRGIALTAAATTRVSIRSNSIHSNNGLGIDLGNNGSTPNDAGDADTGANNLQNFPVLSSVTSGSGNTTFQGTLNSAASTQFRVEFFSNPACDPSGNGEGKVFLGATDVTTDASGNATINTTLPGAATVGDAVTATATDPAGNTSEFSACQTVAVAASTNVSWINAAGGAWNVASNWVDGNSINRVPDAGDDVTIALAGTYTVTLASAVSVNSIALGALSGTQKLDTSNFSLTLANNSNVGQRGVLVVNGTLNGAGNLTVNGTLSGTGTITGNVQNAGTVAPGLSPGVLNIAGNYTQLASGTLAIEIGGTNAGSQHDQLNVTGTVTLDGALHATLTGGYNPGFNDQIVVLTYGTRSGAFSAVNASGFTPTYNANNLTLTSNAPPPTILSVTNTNDTGAGSLRQAIIDSNATAGVQSINFQIASAGVQTITLASALPQITDAVIIDGYTQPGASANTLANGDNAVLFVELNGAQAGAGAHGLSVSAGATTIKGLVINRFTGSGINISGGSNNRIEGNFIGTNATGASALANNRGVDVANSQGNTIGGTTPAARNLLSGNNQGIQLFAGATGTLVQGNFIGTTASGNAALANTLAGLLLNATSGNTVGGTAAGAANVISGNATGIFITQSSASNTVQGNRIGTGADSAVAVPNTLRGIFITQGSNGNTIGGASAGAGNTVAFNNGDGVVVDASVNNPVTGNSIHSNNALGLDLLPVGINANDAFDADSGANNLQNFPLLSSVTVANGNTTFDGTLQSAANTTYALHLYSNAACDGSGNGEGQTYLGTFNVNTNASGDAAFNSTLNGLAVPSNQFVTATATDPAGNTSEFSACLQASAPPNTFTISGQILEGASGRGGVTVTLSGTQSATTTTDANGNYTFASVAAGGNYVVTPSLANYTFAPPSQSFNNLSANQTANFTATLNTYTLSGQVTAGGNGLGGVSVTLTRTGSPLNSTTTTDAGGNYSFTNVAAGGDYVVTPSHPNYSFTPPSRQFSNLSANQTGNFAATINALTIGGQVTENGVALPGVTVTLSGTQAGTATTDANGNYSFNVSAGGNYTVTPSLTHYTFNPPSLSFINLSSNATANFAATRNTHSIGGQIRDNQNAPLASVTVTLSGGQSATTATDANGNYSFTNLPAGANYIVTPSLANYAFTPPSAPFNNLSANATANFTGTLGAHTIGGRIGDANNNSLANVTVTLSGAQSGTALTDAGGNYSFSVAGGASYTVTPTRANYTFAPPSATFNNVAANQTANFTGTLQTFSIGGRIADANNNGIAGASVALSGEHTPPITTDAAGNYSFANVPSGLNYTVTPTLAGYTFLPANATFNNLSANETANFLASAVSSQPQPVNGRVLDKSDGSGISNVTLYVSDATTGAPLATTTTDANGNYTLMLPPGGDYTITTAKAGLTFQPAARTFGNLNNGQTSDFTATEGLSIAGRVAGPNGNGIGNVIVTLSGSVSRTTLTLPNGSFLFNNLPANGNYTVQADSGLLIFNPLQVIRPDLASDTTLNLVAAPRPAPVPTPPLEEDFSGTTRDPLKFSEGTLTQPAGSKDPLVTVVQEGGVLKITPRAGINEASFNGYVTARAIDFTDATASVEVNQIADNGAQTIFGVGRDERNYFRFIAQDVDAPLSPTALQAGAVSKRANGLRRLIFQARSAGVLNGLPPSIPFDPVAHRFWRFRHSSIESAMFFETSPDRVVWTEQRRIALAGPIGLLATELSAGTSGLVTNPGQAIFDNLLVQPNAFVNRANNVRLTQSAYRVNENVGFLTLKAVRAGDTSRETRLDYATEPHDGKPCNTQDGKARARCDFGTTAGTIRFAPGETEKTFNVFITDDIYAEGDETVRIALGFPSAGVVEEPASALVTIVDNDAGSTPHPINTAPFLVRQQYLDFLNREPDADGFNAWVGVLRGCAFEGHFGPGKSGSDPACDRITVSSSFFRSTEFQFKGFFVYRFYKATLGRVPTYEEFLRDMTSVTGQTEAEVVARREAFANAWVERADFVALNEGITNAEFVDQLAATAGVPLAGRAGLILDLNNGSKTRAQVLRLVVDSPELFNREYNAAFVLMQYFGYLQRDPDEAGYDGWLNLLNRTGDYRTMIFGFLYSQEYLLRFGQP
ncbi:MAG TPA: carboxypeptidase regulatory-like domain-containing protein [Pyrinomonadaceae bacterium]|jgi:Tol biopolymer transport system component|nr:carboxypeptidase regulatory-like domain-containing protein [Pyrinomonadaceae bacterium]